jgi:allantoicase
MTLLCSAKRGYDRSDGWERRRRRHGDTVDASGVTHGTTHRLDCGACQSAATVSRITNHGPTDAPGPGR